MGNRCLEGGKPKNKTSWPKGKVVRKLVSNIAGDRALEIQRNIEKITLVSISSTFRPRIFNTISHLKAFLLHI